MVVQLIYFGVDVLWLAHILIKLRCNMQVFSILFIICIIVFFVINYNRKVISLNKYKNNFGLAILCKICSFIFIFAMLFFAIWAYEENINFIIVLAAVLGFIMSAILFYVLGDIAQKVNDIYKNNN